MAHLALFTLATFGTNNLGYRGLLSMFRDSGDSEQFLGRINGELERLPRESSDSRARASALRVLRRYGFDAPNAGGWYADPRGLNLGMTHLKRAAR